MHKLLLLLLVFSCSHRPPAHEKYSRKDWQHWIDENRNCLDTRAEILKLRSLVPVLTNKKGCKITHGKWEDYYYPEIHTLAKFVDIDHLVPLKNAHLSGAASWGHRSKEEFANDPDNLVVTNRSYNRQKGAKGIDEWLPVNKDYACKYIKHFVRIKNKYSLKLLDGERNTYNLLRKECPK